MKKEEIEKMINERMSLNQISKVTGKSLTTVRYWVKKLDIQIKTKNFSEQGKKDYGQSRVCPKCKENCDIDQFYDRRGKKNSSVYCKKCTTIQVVERTKKLKQEMVNYKGGCCEICGYNKYIGALDFHHINPDEKEFDLGDASKYSITRLKLELEKCITLCRNCHSEFHYLEKQQGIDIKGYLN